MLKYLLFTGRTAAIVDIPRDFTSDQYGEIQKRFEMLYGGRNGFACMRRLHDTHREYGVWYDWGLAGSAGASFELFRLPENPPGRVAAAAKKIYRERDVVRLKVWTFTKFVDFPITPQEQAA
jgi:hypothetical protein